MTGEARFVALAPIALAIGALLDEALEGERAEPVLGLLVATGTMVVARDFVLTPEELVSVHTLAKVKWPPALEDGAGLHRHRARSSRRRVHRPGHAWSRPRPRGLARARRRGCVAAAHREGRGRGRPLRHPGRGGHRRALRLVVRHYLVPTLSKHLSFKPLLESYSRFATHGERIGRYKVEAQGAGFYSHKEMVELPTTERVAEFPAQW
jgi:hypothetical protein